MKMLAVILASLAKLAVILKLGLRNISQKDKKSHIFKHIHPPQHALTRIILFFKIHDKANSKFDFKIKEPLHTDWRQPKTHNKII